MFDSSPPPAVLVSLSRGTALAADPPLIAEWRQGYEPVVSVYADGNAFVGQRSDLIDVTLSAAELDACSGRSRPPGSMPFRPASPRTAIL